MPPPSICLSGGKPVLPVEYFLHPENYSLSPKTDIPSLNPVDSTAVEFILSLKGSDFRAAQKLTNEEKSN